MSDFEIVEYARRTLRGKQVHRKIVGEPSWQALKAWRDGGDIGAPSMRWLQESVSDALDEIERRGGVA
jgi:hypothetical protein